MYADNFTSQEIYRPTRQPGYTAWVALWPGMPGERFLAFCEKRRASNHAYHSIPLAFWESMALPYKHQTAFNGGSRDVLTEMVVMRTTDGAVTWREVGRNPTNLYAFFGYLSLPNGDILRSCHNTYLCHYPDDIPCCDIQVSSDMGNTWREHGTVMSEYFTYVHRLKRLCDGVLVAVGFYMPTFGPGRARVQRHTVRPGVRTELMPAVWISHDQGKHWSHPQGIFPGCADIWEPDVTELPSGDLLLLNSSVQAGPQVRQYLRRHADGFIPDPVSDVASGVVPETIVRTPEGLLVGARRNGPYTCSHDDGATWHTIEGLPHCGYQPMGTLLDDGRLLFAWHHGGDSAFGEFDEYVGQHTFRLAGSVSRATSLELRRIMDSECRQYVNAYSATLTADGQPVAGKRIRFSHVTRYTPAWDRNEDPSGTGESATAITDMHGVAAVSFPAWDTELDIHKCYRMVAEIKPEPGDNLVDCRSDIYLAYRVTSRRGCGNPHAFYYTNGTLFVSSDIQDRHPGLGTLVEKLGMLETFSRLDAEEITAIPDSTLTAMLACLVEHQVVTEREDGRFAWTIAPWRPIREVKRPEIDDDFV